MGIPANFIEELNSRTILSELIGKNVKLAKAGREFKGCCPFHNEKTPSFYVNDQKGFYHCFGCAANGDAIKFLMEYEKRSFRESLEILAAGLGMEIPQETKAEKEQNSQNERSYAIMKAASLFFEDSLKTPIAQSARRYLETRRLNAQTIEVFNLGYAPQDSSKLLEYLTAKTYRLEELLTVGLFKASKQPGGKAFSFFRNRIIFPVHDRRGRVVAFGARILEGDGPKYLNSPESAIFHKGSLLYNAHRVLEHHKKGHSIIIAEGYMDAIALFKAGFKGAVAPLGTALTEDQMKESWRLSPGEMPPTLCFDGDNAGLKAGFRTLDRVFPILEPDKTLKVAFMPQGEDPDSLIEAKGKTAMRDILMNGHCLIEVLWLKHTYQKTFSTPEAKAGLKKAIYQDIETIKNKTIQQLYRDAIWNKFREAFHNTKNSRVPLRGNIYALRAREKGLLTEKNAPRRIREALILTTIIHYSELFEEFEDRLLNLLFSDVNYRNFAQRLFLYMVEPPRFLLETLHQHGEFQEILIEILSEKIYIHGNFSRPAGDIDMARHGLDDILTLCEKERVQKDIMRAKDRLKADMTDANLDRFVALKEDS